MYSKEYNLIIGKYLDTVIHRKYTSTRQFCKAYLELEKKSISPETIPLIDDADISRMTNRMSQIKNGSKSIQVEDLPIFTELLEISCEELLSAGKFKPKPPVRITNYDVACSQDQSV